MITSLASRMIVEILLFGKTAAGSRVLLSPTDPIAHMLEAAVGGVSGPVIAIYTGSAKREAKDRSIGGPTVQMLTLYVYIPPSKVTIIEGGLEVEFSDTNAATTLDVIARQIDRALRFGIEPWQSLWNKLAYVINDVTQKPVLVEIEKGVAIPALEIVYDIKTLEEPKYGQPSHFWADFISALGEAGEAGVMADLIRKLIEAPGSLSMIDIARINEGLTGVAYDNIGLGLLADPIDGNPPPVIPDDGVTVDGTITVVVPGSPLT